MQDKSLKNERIAEVLNQKYDLLQQRNAIDKQIKKLEAEEKQWSFADIGPFAVQRLQHVIRSLKDGERPISVQDLEDNVVFDDPEELKEQASRFGRAEAKRQKALEEFQRDLMSTPLNERKRRSSKRGSSEV
jgi:hypothetical protein